MAVPNVAGLSLADATSKLEAEKLVVHLDTDSSDTVAEGIVISQSPSAGVSVKPGTTIGLVISSGKKQGTVPNLVGMDLTNAQNTLTMSGLVLGSQSQANDAATAGQVIAQDPAAGTSVAQGTTVNVVISKGPATAAVPSVVNTARGTAEAQITAAGFVASAQESAVSDPAQDGIVISQNPASGSVRPLGWTVSIVVGRYTGTTT